MATMPSLSRPGSSMSLRPASISQPNVHAALDLHNIPSELQLVLGLLSLQARRPYCDGYVLRKHANLSDGKPAPDQEWYEFFAQLNGTILSLWDAEAVDQAANMGGQSVMPQFINITDAIITTTNPQEHPDHYNVLALSTAGSNRYLFEFQNPNVLKRWSAAFRVAMYERTALQECYTAALIARARTAPNVRRLFSAYHGVLGSKGKYSGWVKVRFSWSIKWQKCWCVVSDTPSSWSAAGPDPGIQGRLLSKFSGKLSLRGEARFYESRRYAKNKPIAILSNAFAAYAVYPEKPFLVDSSTLIKVEGKLHSGRGTGSRMGEQFKDAFILLMPDDLPTTSSDASSPNSSPIIGPSNPARPFSNTARSRFSSAPSSLFTVPETSNRKGTSSAAFESMLTWLIAFYDAFNLYGRPEKLITDAARPESMIFAMPSTLEDSYLDVEDVFVALSEQGNIENNTYSTREWRSKLKELTSTRLPQERKVFNQAILLKNTVAEVPIIRQPIPPRFRNQVDAPNGPIHSESAPAVQFTVDPESHRQVHPPPPAAQRRPSRLGGVLRKKSSRSGPSGHNRSLTEVSVENTRVAMKRFSLNEDSEDDNGSESFQSRSTRQYQSSPLRNSQVLDAEAVDVQARVGRPALTKRASSHRRVHSETRMAEIYRESEGTDRGYNSDEESEGRTPVARRVSSDDMLKAQSGALLGPEQGGGQPGSRGSLETGTQFNHTFDENGHSQIRISESSSDHSYTPADLLRDTPRLDAINLQSSPASSMESLPPSKLQASPPRPRGSAEDRMYNAGPAPPDSSYNSPLFRDQSPPSAFVPVNGQSLPVRREPSPSRPPYAQGPRSAPWSAAPVGPPSRADDVLNYNQEMLRPRDHRPAPTPASTRHPPVVNYPSQPQQFPGAPDNQGSYRQTTRDPQLHAPDPAQHQQRDPYPQNPYYAPGPRNPEDHKVPRRMLPGRLAPASNRSRSNSSGPDGGAAPAAARSAHYRSPSSPAPSQSMSPHKSSSRPGYPQGPRQLAPTS